jgi:predicted PurR-regulated permease PerM
LNHTKENLVNSQSSGEPEAQSIALRGSVSLTASAQWTVRQMIAATFTVVSVALLLLALYRFYMVVFLCFVALSLTVALDPVVTWLHRRGLRREFGVLLIYGLLLVSIAVLLWLMTPLLIEQTRTVLADLPDYYAALRSYLVESRLGLVRGVARTLPPTVALPELAAILNSEGADTGAARLHYLNLGLRTIFAILAVFLLAYYGTLEKDFIVRRLLLRTPVARRDEIRLLIDEFNQKIGGYFRGQLILCVMVGALSLLAFLLLGIPNALFLGLLMGIFEAVPVLGPTLGAIPAVLMTLAVAPEKTLFVVGALIAVQVLENNLLVPRVMDQSVGVNAVVSLLAIAAFGLLFGIAGAILAIPLAAIVQIMLNRLLFEPSAIEDTTLGAPAAVGVSRSYVGVLRLAARELVLAIRKPAANSEAIHADADAEQIYDEIEAIATTLDQQLACMEAQR